MRPSPTRVQLAHKCRYVALLLYLWVSFGPGVGVERLAEANRRRALGVGVEVVEPKTIAGEQPEFGVCLPRLILETGRDRGRHR